MTTTSKDRCPPAAGTEEVAGTEGLDEEQLAAYAKAPGHPARVAIIRLLMQKDACICGDIVDELRTKFVILVDDARTHQSPSNSTVSSLAGWSISSGSQTT